MPDAELLHHAQLIEHARALAGRGLGPSHQADLRRAVSAAYYALFHFLIDAACREFLGVEGTDRPFRNVMTRAFVHGDMADASGPFKARSLPDWMTRELDNVVSQPLSEVARTFIELQEKRHIADYDLVASFEIQAVNSLIDRVQEAMKLWEAVRQQPEARLYLLLLLTWRQVKARKS